MKSVIAAELAALAAWRVVSVGDRIGSLVFNDTEIVETRPHRSTKTVMQILHHVLKHNHALNAAKVPTQNNDQLNRALQEAQRLSGHDCLIVIISDMSGWNDETLKRIKQLSQHNDVMASLVYDDLEKALPENDTLVLSDGQMQVQVNPRKAEFNRRYTEHFESNVEQLQKELKMHRIPVVPMNTYQSVPDQIKAALGERVGHGNER